jgi:hypothetical protein
MTDGSIEPSGIWRRWASLLVIGAVLLPVTVRQPYAIGPPIRSDGVGYHVWTYGLLTGRLSFRWYAGDPATAGLRLTDPEHRVYQNKYPPGVALLRLPFMLWCLDRSQPPGVISPAEHRTALDVGALALLVIVILLLKTCYRLGVSPWATHTAILFLTFGTGLFHYATFDASFSHIFSALGVTVLLWFSVWAVHSRQGRLPIAATALTVCLLLLVRNTNVLFLLFWCATLFIWGWRSGHKSLRVWSWNAAGIAAGASLAVAVQLGLNSYANNGQLVFSSYGGETFLWDRPMLPSVLLSYERGLFTYYPVLAVVLAAGLIAPRTRLATLALAMLFLVYAGLYGFWHAWALGAGFGHRGFVEFVPLAVPLLAASLAGMSGARRKVLLAVGGACVCLTMQLMVSYWCDKLPGMGATANDYWRNSYRIDRFFTVWYFGFREKARV